MPLTFEVTNDREDNTLHFPQSIDDVLGPRSIGHVEPNIEMETHIVLPVGMRNPPKNLAPFQNPNLFGCDYDIRKWKNLRIGECLLPPLFHPGFVACQRIMPNMGWPQCENLPVLVENI
jgi:hypothetical protein